jgi:hypothetical protein
MNNAMLIAFDHPIQVMVCKCLLTRLSVVHVRPSSILRGVAMARQMFRSVFNELRFSLNRASRVHDKTGSHTPVIPR